MSVDMQEILQQVFEMGASDLHIKAGQPPILRISGKLTRSQFDPLTKDETQRLIFSILTSEQRKTLEQTYELDCSYGLEGVGRWRINAYRDRGTFAAAFRTISSTIPSMDELGLPPVVKELVHKPRGLILVTGPTGSGKSTTLAAMIDWINENRCEHILTIEDPIEFLHYNKQSIISQRELGGDTKSFANALRAALREDPDVILVGEMRDLETIGLALTAAETGHLVLGTLHTSSAAQTIDRIVDVFPPTQQEQVRVMLSNGLVSVLSQTLLPIANQAPIGSGMTKGRALAMEILVNTPGIANLIRESKTAQIYSAIQTGGAMGMQTLEACLAQMVKRGLVTYEEAMTKTSHPDDFQRLVSSQSSTAYAPLANRR
jgi:twitching motility protein PilT